MQKKIQTFVIALAMTLTLTSGSMTVFGQTKADNQISNSPQDEQDNALTGVWQSVSPTVDCQTGVPNSPPIRVLFNFMQGGTMSESDTNEIDGPYRAPSEGIWKRTSGRNYTALYLYYVFNPDRTFAVTIKLRENITLSRNGNSFTGRGTFAVFLPDDDVNPIVTGCFTDTAHRLQF